jgi:hypothetical protein
LELQRKTVQKDLVRDQSQSESVLKGVWYHRGERETFERKKGGMTMADVAVYIFSTFGV